MHTLIKQLLHPSVFNHPIKKFAVKETHISWVILTGDYAYKIKKNIAYDFIDYSHLDLREKYCHDELRLNKKLAKDIYLEVIPIIKTKQGLSLGGKGEIIDWAIKMRQFSQDNILKVALNHHPKAEQLIKNLAHQIANFHQQATPSPLESPYGQADSILQPVVENFVDIKALINDEQDLKHLQQIESWALKEHKRLLPTFAARKAQHLIKECHGDMHLGNITLINDQPIIFDCIEFNEYFRWLDVMAEVAFLTMDLCHKDQPELASLFINEYLNQTNDYSGLKVLPFYISYRALVRGKIALFQRSKDQTEAFNAGRLASFRRYMTIALQQINKPSPFLCLMHGVSGSGKSFLSELYLKKLNLIRIRSDVIRKNLFIKQKDTPVTKESLYKPTTSNKTYQELLTLTQQILNTGYSVVIDATFLKKNYRKKFFNLSQQLNTPIIIISCSAPEEILEQNIIKRSTHPENISDATLSTLRQQLRNNEPLTRQEEKHTLHINLKQDINNEQHLHAFKKILNNNNNKYLYS